MSVSMSHISEHVEMPDKMEAHRLRREEKDKIHAKVLLEGAKMGLVTTAGAIAASLAAQRYIPAYARLTLPFRISLVLAASTAGFFTETDRAAMRADREFAQKFSITQKDDVSLAEASVARSWDMETVKQVAFKNRFQLLSWGYLGVVGTTLAYNFSRTDIFLSQNAVAGILLIGAAARIVNGEKKATA
ncbi:hypothetical protein BCR33DRAFT_720122 [Rhizoclosmatium globosum]|uniref:HIG1 domain-containing protein n=1 Tax=Rhizoclosmatium globosum TaxID=329046 RepID=A0A1Y2BX93_9FUNG|nr:hypothetical protein BCR33DRAFT_720122 [Rhizoclosmatium globosum]|eukprot:ORY39284.1 hypothetical protein BCR33DRAFT_720122 [Rhizoclosmatium globosum]